MATGALHLLPYFVRLVARGFRRTRGLSLAILVGLALSTSIWTAVLSHYLRLYGARPTLSPALHQVELPHVQRYGRGFNGEGDNPNTWSARTRVSYPEYQVLAGSGIPTRQTGSVRARVVVAAAGGARPAPGDVANARFVNAAFFAMFGIPLGAGQPFTDDQERAGEAVTVIGERTGRALFGAGDPVGKSVIVDGQPFQVIGVVRGDQPARPDWDVASMGHNQDGLYLPFPWFHRLRARPDLMLYQAPVGWRFDDLLRSNGVFVAHWAELPTPAARAAYDVYLREQFGRRGIKHQLRSWPEWQLAFPLPNSTIPFFMLLAGMVLLGAGFNTARLLLAKGSAQRRELAIHRALGASRWALFARQMIEALILSSAAALLGVAIAVPYNGLYNTVVADSDIPVRITTAIFLAGAGGAMLTGMLAALYPAWRLSLTPPAIQEARV